MDGWILAYTLYILQMLIKNKYSSLQFITSNKDYVMFYIFTP